MNKNINYNRKTDVDNLKMYKGQFSKTVFKWAGYGELR